MKHKNFILPIIILSILLVSTFLVSALPCYNGGTVTLNGNKCVNTFLTNDTFVLTGSLTNAQVLVVAGGGAGGGGANNMGGGGGGGGLVYNDSFSLSSGNYTIIIGVGGEPADFFGGNGTNSSFYNIIAVGGGGGGAGLGLNGGSGGGSKIEGQDTNYAGISTQGNYGGIGYGNKGGGGDGLHSASSGGGGSGSAGFDVTVDNYGSRGGYGKNYTIFNGTTLTYACGGGGAGGGTGLVGIGGCINAGIGAKYGIDSPTSAENGTGSGGGGGAGLVGNKGGAGGSGIVIITYDTLTPQIEFVSPTDENGDSYQRQNILINTSVINDFDLINIYVYNSTFNQITNLSSASSPFFQNFSIGTDGTFYFNATACGSSGCDSTETRTVYLDTFNPVVDITYPDPNNLTFNHFINTINFTVLNTGSIDTCLVSINNGANVSVPNCTEGNVMTYSGFNSTEGLNTVTVWANDTVSLFGSHTHIFTIDTIPPTIEIASPTNTTYTSVSQLINITSDGNVIYNFDGTNQTYTGITFVDFNEGTNVLNVYATDEAGNFNSESVSFTVTTPVIPLTPIPSTVLSSPIYQIMASSGAGLGIFIEFMGRSLPFFLLALGFVAIFIAIGYAIANAMKESGLKVNWSG